jgi:hypothetical protein
MIRTKQNTNHSLSPIGVHTGQRLMSRCQPPTEYFDTLEEAQTAFERYKARYCGDAPYAVRGIEWASIYKDGKAVWREKGLPANL